MKKQRQCMIAGCSSGIGSAIAEMLKKENYDILGMQRRPPGLQVDLSRINEIPNYWKRGCEKLNGIPTLAVLVTGVPLEQKFLETQSKTIEELILINLISPLVLAKEILNTWVKEKISGHLIFIGSQAALPGAKQIGNVVYTASKGGIHAIIGPLANEYGPLIRVNAIAPGDVITEKEDATIQEQAYLRGVSFSQCIEEIESASALKRRVRAEEVAQAVLFLEQCHAMSGSIINISAGKTAH